MIVCVTRVGVISLPAFTRNFVNIDIISNLVNDMYMKYPVYGRMLFADFAKIIKGAYIILGPIQQLKDIHPLIRKLEAIEGIELTDDQKNKIIKQTKDVVKDVPEIDQLRQSLDVQDNQDNIENIEDYIDQFFNNNSILGI